MIKRTKLLTLLCLCIGITFAGSLISCTTTSAQKAAGSAAVSVAGDGLPKHKMTITGSCFKPGELIELELDLDGVPLIIGNKGKPIIASGAGDFKVTSLYPNKLMMIPGSWDMTASGDKGTVASTKVKMGKK